jgi:hypothetical protein
MTGTQAERLRALEVLAEHHAKEISELRKLNSEMVKFVAVQTALNQAAKVQHAEEYGDRWQVWLRWLISPGLPAGAIILLLWKVLTEGTQ